jgi:hypothetical protein
MLVRRRLQADDPRADLAWRAARTVLLASGSGRPWRQWSRRRRPANAANRDP